MQKDIIINNTSTRNYTIDLFKFIAALLIIGIHTAPFSDIDADFDYFFVNILCRLAVPFFAVCSGFYMSQSLIKCDYCITSIKRQETKLIKIYIVWTIIYFLYDIPFSIIGGYCTLKNYIGFAISIVTKGSCYHLWYLLSLIYALPLFYICIKCVKKRTLLLLLIIVLYITKVISYGYAQWLPGTIVKIFDVCHNFDALFNAVFLLLPLMLTGHLISAYKIPNKKICVIGIAVSFLFWIIEAIFLKSFSQKGVSFVIMTLPTAFFNFSAVIQLSFANNLKISKVLGSLSLFMYCFHPIVVGILPKELFSLFRYIVVVAISVIVAIVYYCVKVKIQNKKKSIE